MTVQKGVHFQTCENTAEPSANHRELSQDGPSTPNTIHRKLLIRHHSPFSIQWIEMKAGRAGTAQSNPKPSKRALAHPPGRIKKPDSRSARNSFTFTPKARKISVFTTGFR